MQNKAKENEYDKKKHLFLRARCEVRLEVVLVDALSAPSPRRQGNAVGIVAVPGQIHFRLLQDLAGELRGLVVGGHLSYG